MHNNLPVQRVSSSKRNKLLFGVDCFQEKIPVRAAFRHVFYVLNVSARAYGKCSGNVLNARMRQNRVQRRVPNHYKMIKT